MKRPFIKINYIGGSDILNTDRIVKITAVKRGEPTKKPYGVKISLFDGVHVGEISYYKETEKERDELLDSLYSTLNEPIIEEIPHQK